eukprot:11385953-Prorocentrum_lima.AAC.1
MGCSTAFCKMQGAGHNHDVGHVGSVVPPVVPMISLAPAAPSRTPPIVVGLFLYGAVEGLDLLLDI